MNFIKVNGQFINLDNVTTINFSTQTVVKASLSEDWFITSIPDNYQKHEQRQSLIATIEYTNSEESYSRIIDAEPLQAWLNKTSVDVADVHAESEALEPYRYGIKP